MDLQELLGLRGDVVTEMEMRGRVCERVLKGAMALRPLSLEQITKIVGLTIKKDARTLPPSKER